MKLTDKFLDAVHNREPVSGYTHEFYRYPARFSPLFVREAIQAFTRPGDTILDPFMGGGTTLVESAALGRQGVGSDISSLAVFIAKAKTTLLTDEDLDTVLIWAYQLTCDLTIGARGIRPDAWARNGYYRNINSRSSWRIRKLLELAMSRVGILRSCKQQRFARCILLKTAQWALDCRTKVPPVAEFRNQLAKYAAEMIEAARCYALVVKKAQQDHNLQRVPTALCLQRSAIGLETESRLAGFKRPALVLTSPPYPGVHVLYHRWQVQGRKESPAPFWIANSRDGNGAAFYTFCDRKNPTLQRYFEQALAAFRSLAVMANRETLIVQLIGFSQPEWQLQRYLSVMEEAGYQEVRFQKFLGPHSDGRLWRSVPNRKWYAEQKGSTSSSNEVVLFHRLK